MNSLELGQTIVPFSPGSFQGMQGAVQGSVKPAKKGLTGSSVFQNITFKFSV
jgi:hypothetical protein